MVTAPQMLVIGHDGGRLRVGQFAAFLWTFRLFSPSKVTGMVWRKVFDARKGDTAENDGLARSTHYGRQSTAIRPLTQWFSMTRADSSTLDPVPTCRDVLLAEACWACCDLVGLHKVSESRERPSLGYERI